MCVSKAIRLKVCMCVSEKVWVCVHKRVKVVGVRDCELVQEILLGNRKVTIIL